MPSHAMDHLIEEESHDLLTRETSHIATEGLAMSRNGERQVLNPVSLGVSNEVGDVCAPRSAWRGYNTLPCNR